MISFRPFLNSDPPLIAEVWRSQPPMEGLVQSVSPAMLEYYVFSKPYFDRKGLILAFDGDEPVGFVHAGFGSNEEGSEILKGRGVTCLLMVVPREDRKQIAADLLTQSEQYLASEGAQEFYVGCAGRLSPFYLGMYGGSETPGILSTDTMTLDVSLKSGYAEVDRWHVLRRSLVGFRPVVDRVQMQHRRQYNVDAMIDPPTKSWWESCKWGVSARTSFILDRRGAGRAEFGHATFWDIDPLATYWGVRASGLIDLEIAEEFRGQGLATFLVGESLRQLQSIGVTRAEIQVPHDNSASNGLFTKLGFEKIDEGIVLKKQTS